MAMMVTGTRMQGIRVASFTHVPRISVLSELHAHVPPSVATRD
jgi:hypothetical protein